MDIAFAVCFKYSLIGNGVEREREIEREIDNVNIMALK